MPWKGISLLQRLCRTGQHCKMPTVQANQAHDALAQRQTIYQQQELLCSHPPKGDVHTMRGTSAWDSGTRCTSHLLPRQRLHCPGCQRKEGSGHLLPQGGMSDELPLVQRHVTGARTVRTLQYDMVEFVDSCVGSYCVLSGKPTSTLHKAPTQSLSEDRTWDPATSSGGALAPVALRVLMKVLYCARMARPDLLRATCVLARRVTKWCPD